MKHSQIQKLMFLFTIISVIQIKAILQPCILDSNCPSNAFCGFRKLCVCQDNYIMGCDITSQKLSANPLASTITQTYTYFTISPNAIYEYIKFNIDMTTTSVASKSIIATLWGQSGYLIQMTDINKMLQAQFNISTLSMENLQTTYFQFGLQPNGESQVLYLGVRIDSAIPDSIDMSLSVIEENAYNQDVFKLVITILMAVLSVACLVLIAFCIYKKRMMSSLRSRAQQQKSVKSTTHFDQYMPIVSANRVKVPLQVCSVCLNDITIDNLVRLTVCRHLFHAQCIDSWCKKNISCPICRQQFDLQNCQKILGQGIDLSTSRSHQQQRGGQMQLVNKRPNHIESNRINHEEFNEESIIQQDSMRRNML